MSGDVQPRKRKDKKKKKDDLGFEEPRGTAAIFGDGDAFIHSYQDHGTGGHWCAKIIFFSLLAVLVSLIGLIILENRGLTELEANSVESRYSGVLEGWIEDLPDDDHHDEHTLELKHHDDKNNQDSELEKKYHEDYTEEKEESEEAHDNDSSEIEENDLSDEVQEDDVDEQESEENNNYVSDEIEKHQEEDNDDNEDDSDEIEKYEKYNDYNEEDIEEQKDVSYETEDDENDNNNELIYDSNETEEKYKDDRQNEVPRFVSNELEEDDEDEANYRKQYDRGNKYQVNEDSNNGNDALEDSNEDIDESTADRHYSHIGTGKKYDIQKDNDEQITRTKRNTEFHYDDASLEDSKIHDDDDDNNEIQKMVRYSNYESQKKYVNNDEDDEEHEQENDSQEQENIDIEHIEREITDDDILSVEVKEQSDSQEHNEDTSKENENSDAESEDEDFLDPVDDDEPPIERITAPSGSPYVEIEDEVTEKPIDTLEDEEKYEKQQEERRREVAEASNMWLKLVVGGALLVATHAVLRRVTSPRVNSRTDAPDETEETTNEESVSQTSPSTTLLSEEPLPKSTTENIYTPPQKRNQEDVAKTVKNIETASQPKLDEVAVKVTDHVKNIQEMLAKPDVDKELYSDEDEEIEEEDEITLAKEETKPKSEQNKVGEQEETDDVEIIDDEQIEEELDEEVVEEEISDVDDTELLTRLEAKYGRLPEPERYGRHKDGGNSIGDEWPGEPSDSHWRHELDLAEEELRQGAWSECARRVSPAPLANSARARWLAAKALDVAAEENRDNRLLSRAITAYLHLLKMNENLPDKKLIEIAQRTINRMQFRGMYINTEPIYRILIRKFPSDVHYRNNLTVAFLMANRADLADGVLKETLKLWPNDRIALAHYGFVLKNHYNKLEESVTYLREALDGDDAGQANEPRFYYHLGDALLLLGRFDEAFEVHKRGAELGHFLSPSQRSLYNVPRLKSRPWWRVEDTPYAKFAQALEKNWREILKEGEAAKEIYEKEKEGLKEKGEWSQLDLFVQGRELPGRCKRAPVTCAVVQAEPAAAGCRRGQVKFSNMAAGTHVRAHVGPTNCRLRMHLGLSHTDHTFIRVDREIRQWQVGKTLMFDDSFEHEVWHNGTGSRLVLIVDVWHPDLTAAERRQLPAI